MKGTNKLKEDIAGRQAAKNGGKAKAKAGNKWKRRWNERN
jgi:hypothetical protein